MPANKRRVVGPDIGGAFPKLRRTNFRWVICGMVAAMALILFLDRTSISVAAPMMMQEFGLSKTQMGLVFSAFAWGYAIGNVPGGWLGDRYGPRLVLTGMVLFWSVMTFATAHAVGLASLLAIRFVFGLGEAGAWPTATRAMVNWFPKSERGIVSGTTHSAALFATSAVPLLSVFIIEAFGWRALFHIFAVLGLIWAACWWLIYRNSPEQRPQVNAAELAHIGRNAAIPGADDASPAAPVPWSRILRSKNLWFLGFSYIAFNYTSYFFYFWLPTYLVEHHHVSLTSMGVLASAPLGAGAVGSLCGGLATDFVYRRTKNLRIARRLVCVVSMLGAALFMGLAGMSAAPVFLVAYLSLAVFFLGLVLAPTWSVAMDVSGEYSGTVSGVMNMVGTGGASISPIIFGALTQAGYWTAPFIVTSAVLLVAAATWAFLIDPDRSVLER